MMALYERLTREYFLPYYVLNRNSNNYNNHKKKFKELKRMLDTMNISSEEYIKVQFSTKGNRPFPNQLTSKAAIKRYNTHTRTQNIKELLNTQESYLKNFLNIGYTLEEALQFDMFFYFFRCIKLKNHPKKWKLKAKQEINDMPELKKIIKL